MFCTLHSPIHMERALGRVRKDGRNDIHIECCDQPFVEDDHIESGGGVGDEVAEHVHLCNRVVFSEKPTSSQPLDWSCYFSYHLLIAYHENML